MSLIAHYTLDNQAGVRPNLFFNSQITSMSSWGSVNSSSISRVQKDGFWCLYGVKNGTNSLWCQNIDFAYTAGSTKYLSFSAWIYVDTATTYGIAAWCSNNGWQHSAPTSKAIPNTNLKIGWNFVRWNMRIYHASYSATRLIISIAINSGSGYMHSPKIEEILSIDDLPTAYVPHNQEAAYSEVNKLEANIVQTTSDTNNHTPKNNMSKTTGLTYSTDSVHYTTSTRFNGSDSYLLGTYPNTLKPSPLTLSIWYKPDVLTGTQLIWGCWESGGGGFELVEGKFRAEWYCNGYQVVQADASTGWHMLTCTYDNQYLKLYVDGQLKATYNRGSAAAMPYEATTRWQIGGNPGGSNAGSGTCSGLMNDARMYDHAMTADQVLDLYNGGDGYILPSEYQEVEYIAGTGAQYLNTGFNPNWATRVVMTCMPTAWNSPTAWFGAREAITTNNFNIWITDALFGAQYNNNDWSDNQKSIPNLTNKLMQIDFNKNVCTVNGVTATFASAKFSCSKPLFLMALNHNGTKDGRDAIGRLYSCTIFNDDVLVRKFVPCKRKSDYKPGLFDVVNNVFYTNAGTSEFTCGSDVIIQK